ncbi:hypothetical protein MMC30_008720 [Trapelia coarctata]|nr:hypothetical protein [Trapelia coarctata]
MVLEADSVIGSSSFAEAIKVEAIDSYTYTGYFPDQWCIGSVPHGGYVTSTILSVASLHFRTTLSSQNQPHTLTLHLTFLRRTSTGRATFKVKDVKLGRQTSTIHITLTQGDSRDKVVGYITHSNISLETGVTLPTNWELHPAPYPANVKKLQDGTDPHWRLLEQMPFAAFRKASTNVQFYFPQKGQQGKSLTDEWIRFSNGEKFTTESIGYVADTFPQIVEAYRDDRSVQPADGRKWPSFWYPTILLNLEIKKVLPPEGVEWLFVRVQAKQIKNGRMDLEVVILDAEGDLVALSQHVSLVVGAERNIAGREKGGVGQEKSGKEKTKL